MESQTKTQHAHIMQVRRMISLIAPMVVKLLWKRIKVLFNFELSKTKFPW